MRIKKVLGMMMAIAMVGMVTVPSITSEAAGLTQVQNPTAVTYGKVSDADKALLMQLFDAEYYLAQNPDLVELYGNDIEALFNHFCTLGIFEGRTCNANFDPSAYASAYEDLFSLFGNDILKYYEHYLTLGAAEERNITTIAACAENGITVESLATPEVKVTPAAYKIATIMGTNDFAAVQQAVDRAVAQASSSSDGTGSSSVTVASDSTSGGSSSSTLQSVQRTKALTEIGTITVSADGVITILVIKGSTGYGGYRLSSDFQSQTKIYETTGYIAPSDTDWNGSNCIARINLGAMNGTDIAGEIEESSMTVTSGTVPTGGIGIENYSNSASPDYNVSDNVTGDGETITYGSGSWSTTKYLDPAGNASTEFTYGMDIEENSDGSVVVKTGLYNEVDGVGMYNETTVTEAPASSSGD